MNLGHLRWRWYQITKHHFIRGLCVRCDDSRSLPGDPENGRAWCLKGRLAIGGGALIVLHLLCHEVPLILALGLSVLKSAGWLAE